MTAAAALMTLATPALAGPTGGTVVGGSATIAQSGGTTNINQFTNSAIINWQTFSIGSKETVNFFQPSATSVILNRVIGNEQSIISGALNANGQVFIVNSAGVVFSKGSQVNVGGLVASTRDISNADFMAGNFSFSGSSAASIVNKGNITASPGGYVALLGKTVKNDGVISAKLGTVALASGDKITLNFGGNSLVNVTIDKGTFNALVENGRLIKADGGTVILTAKAADQILSAQVNNTGIIQARTMASLMGGSNTQSVHVGTIKLLASGGTVHVSGKLDASAPKGGKGGTIETSGSKITVANNAVITTKAANGQNGTWIIDPDGFTIAATGGDITGAKLSSELASNNISILSTQGTTAQGDGNLNVNDVVTWGTANTLSLTATNAINVNAVITAPAGSLTLNAGTDININAPSSVQVATLNATAGSNINLNAPQTWANNGNWTFNGTNINVNDTVNWSNGTLAFNAGATGGFINVNAAMTASNNASFVATYDTAINTTNGPLGGFNFLFQSATAATTTTPPIAPTPWSFVGSLNFTNTALINSLPNNSSTSPLTINGNPYNLITSIGGSGTHDLSIINTNGGAGYYALASNLTSGTAFTADPLTSFGVSLTNPTSSILEGLGNSISGVTVTVTGSQAAFIGNNYGTIRDLNLTNATINLTVNAGGGTTGALVGTNSGSIINTYVSGTVNVTGGSSPGLGIGGVVGTNESIIYGTQANVNVNATDSYIAGGFVGENNSYTNPAVILNSASYGTLTIYETNYGLYSNQLGGAGQGTAFGGFVAQNNGGVISNSLSDGGVIASSAAGSNIPFQYLGGFVGFNQTSSPFTGTINNSVSYTTLSSTTTVPGHSSGAYSYGLSGSFAGEAWSGQINNSAAFGMVSLTGTHPSTQLGGFAGKNSTSTFTGDTFNTASTGQTALVGRGSAGTGITTTTNTIGSPNQGPPASNAAQTAANARSNAQTLTGQATAQQIAVAQAAANAAALAAAQAAAAQSAAQQAAASAANVSATAAQIAASTPPNLTLSKAGTEAGSQAVAGLTPPEPSGINKATPQVLTAEQIQQIERRKALRLAATIHKPTVKPKDSGYGATIRSIEIDGQRFNLQKNNP